eukprot:9168268-Lingulodinium_polyedra.AAC.1
MPRKPPLGFGTKTYMRYAACIGGSPTASMSCSRMARATAPPWDSPDSALTCTPSRLWAVPIENRAAAAKTRSG